MQSVLLGLVAFLAVALVIMSVLWWDARRAARVARDALHTAQRALRDSRLTPHDRVSPMSDADPEETLPGRPRSAAPIARDADAGTEVDARDGEANRCWLEAPGGERRSLPFDRSTLGRDPRNTVLVDDSQASRLHCEIVYAGGRLVLRDNDSANGTRINGEPVQSRALEFGDRIEIGDCALVFGCEGFALKDHDPTAAVEAVERLLAVAPDFLPALKLVAFLLERDVARQHQAQAYWQRIAVVERGR